MARTPKRLAGPALVSNAAATKYTVPALTTAVIRYLHVSNPSGSAATFTLSITADATGTRMYGALSIPANSVYERHVYWVMTAAEILQAFSGTNNVLTLTLFGDEIA
jgi:hypothetical protein